MKINKMAGMRTVDESRDIPDSNAFSCANSVIEDGQIKTRNGFEKVNTTKFGAAISGLYDYKGRIGGFFPIITTSGSVYDMLSHYVVSADATITVGVAFTLTVTAYNLLGNVETNYNGTCNLTENGDGSLTVASLTFVQGVATTSTIVYNSGSPGTLTITATDNGDSTLFGSTTATVQANPWTLLYTGGRGGTYGIVRTRTASDSSDAVFDSKLYFITGAEDVNFKDTDPYEMLDVISVDTGGNYVLEDSIDELYTGLGMCIVALGANIYVGTGINGKAYYSSDGNDFSSSVTIGGSTVYCLDTFNGKYYAGTGYLGQIFESSDLSTWNQVHAVDVGIMRFVTFNSKLYAGTSIGQSIMGGVPHIVRTSDGSTWATVLDGTKTQFFGLEVFDGYIYAGEHDDTDATAGKIYRSNNGTDWSEVLSTGEDFPYVMCVVGTKLYVGCADGKLYYTENGTDWSYATSPTNEDIFGLAYWNGTFFVTTQNYVYSYAG